MLGLVAFPGVLLLGLAVLPGDCLAGLGTFHLVKVLTITNRDFFGCLDDLGDASSLPLSSSSGTLSKAALPLSPVLNVIANFRQFQIW